MKRILLIGISLAACALALLFPLSSILTPKASALSGSDWQAGNILDDSVLYNVGTMTASEIQTFLSSKLPSCDTSGALSITYFYNAGSGQISFSDSTFPGATSTTSTRALFGQRYAAWFNNHPFSGYFTNESLTPFVCLKDYSENVADMPADAYCQAVTGGALSAATIIRSVSTACGINPQVLVVILQKEQGLVTDDWPWTSEYKFATGFCVYDNPNAIPPSCQGTSGFFNQVYYAARQFKKYAASPTSYNYRAGINAAIPFSPDGNCGSSSVFLQTQATADLYNYTPYQPNAGALAGLNGSTPGGTAPCGAYGNRNFWWYFWNWFGSPLFSRSAITLNTISQPDPSPAIGEQISYQVSFTNNLAASITLDAVGIVGRLNDMNTGANRDMGWVGPVTLAAGQTSQVFVFTATVRDAGTIYVWPAISYHGLYAHYNPWGETINTHAPNLSLSQQASTNTATIYAGQNVTFSAVLKNNEPQAISYDAIGIPVRYNGANYDAAWVGPGTIGAGQELSVSGVRTTDKLGPYTYWVSDFFGGKYTTIGTVKQLTAVPVSPNFSVSGLAFSSASPVAGQTLSATFSITNNLPVPIDVDAVGVVGRFGTFTGPNRDLNWQGLTHFNIGETKAFTETGTVAEAGTHYYWIGILFNGLYYQYNNWGSTIVSLAPNFSVSALTFTDTSPVVGTTLGASFSVTNNLPVPIDVDAVGVVGRFGTFTGPNRDIGWQGPIHFNANETKAFSGYSRTITDVGTHYYWIGIFYNGSYIQYNNWGSTIVSRAN